MFCKIDSVRIQALINAQDRGGLWRVNDNVQNIFIECEKIFLSFTLNFQTVIYSVQLVQEMQRNPWVISNFDVLYYNTERKVNKENMMLSFAFSFASDVKERFKARIKKSKSRSLRKEIKKAASIKNLDQKMH